MSEEKKYPVQRLCEYLHLSRGAYYRWLKDPVSFSEKYNKEISEKIKSIHGVLPVKRTVKNQKVLLLPDSTVHGTQLVSSAADSAEFALYCSN